MKEKDAKEVNFEEKNKKKRKKKKNNIKKEEIKKVKVKKINEDKKDKNDDEKIGIKNIIELIAIILFIVCTLIFGPNYSTGLIHIIYIIVVLLLILSLLIFVHEFGHFIMAKKFGVHVYEFAIGMGPLVLSFRRKNDPTLYTLRAFPIGGFNSIAGESYEDDDSLPKSKLMCNKPKWQRLLILVAGVTMNFITAFILLFFISLIWGSCNQASVIGGVEENSAAYNAGLVEGDKITKINGKSIKTWDDISLVMVLKNKNSNYEIEYVDKDLNVKNVNVTPSRYLVSVDGGDDEYLIPEGKSAQDVIDENKLNKNKFQEISRLGIMQSGEVKKGFGNALNYAHTKFWSLVRMMLNIIGALFTGKIGLDALSGPVGMYTVVGSAAAYGIVNLIYLAAYLSINLGVINILPFPAFDGGHVLFVLIELITGHRVNEKIEGYFHAVGFALILLLMVIVTIHDVLRIF